MSARTRAALAGLCLALAAAQGAPMARADAADEGAEPAAGVLSRIVEWFRSDDAAAAPAHLPEPAAAEAMSAPAAAPATLGDVDAAVRDAIAEIALLRAATGVAPAPARERAAPREDVTPAHVHARAIEVLAKTARSARRLGMVAAHASRPPVTGFAPDDLHRAARAIVGELRRIKRQLVVEAAIEPAAAAGATPPSLDAELAHASALLDALVGRPPSLNDVMGCVARIHDELRAVAAALGAVLPDDAPAAAAPRERAPAQVAQQLLRAAYKAIALQTALGMEASGVPAVALEGATPGDALEAATALLGEVLRIRAHLGAGPAPPAARPAPGGGVPAADVYAAARLAVAQLDAMMRSAGDAR